MVLCQVARPSAGPQEVSRSGHIAVYHDLEISGFGLDLSQDLEIEVRILGQRSRS